MGHSILRGRATLNLTRGLLVLVLLGGCAGLKDAEGTEAAILKQAEGLVTLPPAGGDDARSTAQNGLLLSPSVREAASKVSASADEVRVERAVLFPSLGLTLGGGIGDAGNGDPALNLQGSQRLFDFGDSERAITLADLDLQIAYFAFHKAVDNSLVELLEAYDKVQMHTELLAVYRNQLSAMQQLETLVRTRTERGAATSSDLLESRKRLQAAAFLVNDTELTLAEARDRLTRLSGGSRGGRITIEADACGAQGISDDMRMAQLELARAQVAAERAERARMPRIVLSPLARSEISGGGTSLGLNVGVQSDVLQGGALTARVRAARNNLSGAQARLDSIALDDDLDERALQRTLTAGARRTELLQRQIALLSETRDVYRSQYFDMGTRQISELLENEEEYYSRQAELVEQRSNLAVARLDCAARSRSLRQQLELAGYSLYGFPLTLDPI